MSGSHAASEDGGEIIVDSRQRLIYTSDGNALVVEGNCDITERKRAEKASRESAERFQVTFEQAAVGMAHVGTNGEWLLVNQRLREMVGYSRDELLAAHLRRHHPSGRSRSRLEPGAGAAARRVQDLFDGEALHLPRRKDHVGEYHGFAAARFAKTAPLLHFRH
jgi:PAS domain-containing protein